MKTIILALFCFSIQSNYSIGYYKKGDKLYNWNRSGLELYSEANNKSQIIGILSFETECIVTDDNLRKSNLHFVKIGVIAKDESKDKNSTTFNIYGFWVKIKTKDGQSGYVFDGYLSKIKPGFELNDSYFDKEFKLIKSKISKPNPKMNNAYSNFYLYKTGAWIKKKGTDHNVDIHYFIPNISLEEAFILIKNPNLFELKETAENPKIINFNGNELQFSSTLENTTLKKINTKTRNGVEIIFNSVN